MFNSIYQTYMQILKQQRVNAVSYRIQNRKHKINTVGLLT